MGAVIYLRRRRDDSVRAHIMRQQNPAHTVCGLWISATWPLAPEDARGCRMCERLADHPRSRGQTIDTEGALTPMGAAVTGRILALLEKSVRIERETKGRYAATISWLRGALAHGDTAVAAGRACKILSLRIVADLMESGELAEGH